MAAPATALATARPGSKAWILECSSGEIACLGIYSCRAKALKRLREELTEKQYKRIEWDYSKQNPELQCGYCAARDCLFVIYSTVVDS